MTADSFYIHTAEQFAQSWLKATYRYVLDGMFDHFYFSSVPLHGVVPTSVDSFHLQHLHISAKSFVVSMKPKLHN